MSTFNYAKMSKDERQFIRMYCMTLQQEYDLLQIIRGLMAPSGLAITCTVSAARHAVKLHKMQKTFHKKVLVAGAAFRLSDNKDNTDLATPEQIASIFTQSFFKLVDSDTKKALLTDKNLPSHDGWSSGHPIEWQQMIKSLQEIHAQQLQEKVSGHSAVINALLNLFNILPAKLADKKWEEEDDWGDYYDEDDNEDGNIDYFM